MQQVVNEDLFQEITPQIYDFFVNVPKEAKISYDMLSTFLQSARKTLEAFPILRSAYDFTFDSKGRIKIHSHNPSKAKPNTEPYLEL